MLRPASELRNGDGAGAPAKVEEAAQAISVTYGADDALWLCVALIDSASQGKLQM
jgi:hypothetical protein